MGNKIVIIKIICVWIEIGYVLLKNMEKIKVKGINFIFWRIFVNFCCGDEYDLCDRLIIIFWYFIIIN